MPLPDFVVIVKLKSSRPPAGGRSGSNVTLALNYDKIPDFVKPSYRLLFTFLILFFIFPSHTFRIIIDRAYDKTQRVNRFDNE